MKKLDNRGFGVIEGLLILIIVGIVGATGFYVYKANNKLDNGDDGTTIVQRERNNKDQKSEDETDKDYLLIEEWGVKVPQMPEGNEISYKINVNDKNFAHFVSSEQKALGGYCGEFSASRYSIYKAEAGYESGDSILKNRLNEAVKQNLDIEIDGDIYYVLGDFSGGDCTGTAMEGDGVSKQETKANNNLLNSLKGLVKA